MLLLVDHNVVVTMKLTFFLVIVQDKNGGRVTNVVDNRAALAVNRMTGGSQEGNEAMNKLLTGGK